MANTRSAKKMIRKIVRRTQTNGARKSRIATFMRRANAHIEAGKNAEAREAFLAAEREVMRGVSKNIMHKNKGARIVSALARRLNKMGKAAS